MIGSVARISDLNTVFFGCTPDYALQGSPDYLVNGLGVHRKTDRWSVHACTHGNSYFAILNGGATNVTANGLPIGRVGDPVIRFQKVAGNKPFQVGMTTVATGSPDTFIGTGAGGGPVERIFRAGTARAGDPLASYG